MNTNYLFEYISIFERVLSTAYKTEYYLPALEKSISGSSFFQSLEHSDASVIIDEASLIKQIYPEFNVNMSDIPSYNQCMWAAEAYIRIQNECHFTFELIFLYIPIRKMYEYFPLYHEMDFSQIIDEFMRLYSKKSVIALLLDKYSASVQSVSNYSGIPYTTLYSFKQRRRDIKKVNIENIYKLSQYLNVRIETISELEIE